MTKNSFSGLKKLREVAAGAQNTGGGGFLRLKDGQSVTVRFLQELDEAGKFYDVDRGLAVSVFEHSNPDDFSQRFLCTSLDEGKCVGCERVVINNRWKKRSRLYINAYVVEEESTQIIATGFSSKGIGGALIEYADDFGSISDRNYKLKRAGEGLKTSYTIYPREVSDFQFEKGTVRDLSNLTTYRTYTECTELVDGSNEFQTIKNDW